MCDPYCRVLRGFGVGPSRVACVLLARQSGCRVYKRNMYKKVVVVPYLAELYCIVLSCIIVFFYKWYTIPINTIQ